MKRAWILLCCGGLALMVLGALVIASGRTSAATQDSARVHDRIYWERGFDVQIRVNGYPVEEYASRGRKYVEAIEGAEYEVSVHNPLPYRVAVALSVDGLNTIDARRSSAWNASKWVIEPYGTINISGWQMSSQRARRFYFTSERDSYGAKLGQTGNLGVISAVFFRERRPIAVPITPPGRKHPVYEEDTQRGQADAPPSAGSSGEQTAKQRQGEIAPMPDDDYAATGIGRSVHNDVRWVNMDLDSRPAAEVMIRYEYYPALVRLGILPRRYPRPDPLRQTGRRDGI